MQRIVERTLHLAIEACMDIADHIVADRRLRVPETGAETFEVLGEAKMLPLGLAEALAKMVGFRNILVHDYAKLDPVIVLRVLGTDLQDLMRFRDAILQLENDFRNTFSFCSSFSMQQILVVLDAL